MEPNVFVSQQLCNEFSQNLMGSWNILVKHMFRLLSYFVLDMSWKIVQRSYPKLTRFLNTERL